MFSFCTAHTTNSCSTCVARETFETVFQCPARPWGTKHLCFAKEAEGSCGDGTSPNRRHERKTFAPAGSRKDDDLKLHLLLGANLLSGLFPRNGDGRISLVLGNALADDILLPFGDVDVRLHFEAEVGDELHDEPVTLFGQLDGHFAHGCGF
jgi:hypothetical protein